MRLQMKAVVQKKAFTIPEGLKLFTIWCSEEGEDFNYAVLAKNEEEAEKFIRMKPMVMHGRKCIEDISDSNDSDAHFLWEDPEKLQEHLHKEGDVWLYDSGS